MSRIGVAFPGDPSEASTWSGTPSGVMRGLAGAGVEPVAINVAPPPLISEAVVNAIALRYLRPQRDVRAAISRGRAAGWASPGLARVISVTAARALRAAGPLDGVVQIGTGYALPADVPIATLEDMTVAQTRERGRAYAGWDTLTPRAFAARLERQRRAYASATAVCLTSGWAADSVLRDYGIPPAKVHVVGIGRNHTAPALERDWSSPRFLFVGMDWPRKNGDGVLRAFERLREERPDARLDLVGGHPEVHAPGVTGHGVLRLDVPEQHARLDRLFGEATCFVMPSFSEAAGVVYVEAAAAGLPSIGTTAGGAGYLIGDGGVVVDPHDDAALLAAMRRLADADVAERTGAAAKLRSERFTWDQVGKRLLRALEGHPAEAEAEPVVR
ncbi:glycosyltransferase family 4 protein [Solirubrobacter phytolaccae]|uniref:Glycosyltransferase family 4 protein n=1 Tax=Solirubrobacter phytolaccae TaxID=1404360 RepID=A0A9X3N5V2_9ACTN|nr:glycosyltransferase family 4 protein [Solirubrobacter phytolaccae]MDA0180313.1 glycosyltransferase family 4 protein [Solirubrobacter phytolaccae]